MAPTLPIRTALIGLGNSGQFYHLPHLSERERFDLRVVVAEHDESAGRIAQLLGAEASTDWRSVVARSDIELVVIALPHSLHHAVTLAALEHGKHVLVEKPMALTVAHADEMLDAARHSGTMLMVHHQRRWEADFVAILDSIRSGEIGDVWRVVVARSHQGRYRKASAHSPHDGAEMATWAEELERGGGISQVVGPHPVDHLLTLADSAVASVNAKVHYSDGDEVEDWIGIDVGFSSGVTGRVDVFRWSGIAPPRFAVYGTKGTAVSESSTEVNVKLHNGRNRRMSGLPVPGILGDEIYDDIFQAIRNGRDPRLTAFDARAVVEVLDMSRRSAESGGVLISPP